jgi:hypothetical protein
LDREFGKIREQEEMKGRKRRNRKRQKTAKRKKKMKKKSKENNILHIMKDILFSHFIHIRTLVEQKIWL